jgi:hypothetical protein
MKLNEIKPILTGEYDLSEGVIPVHISMTLAAIIRDGKITNNVQTFVLGSMCEMFKDGSPHRMPRDINAYGMTTDAQLIEDLRTLSDADSVALATWIMESLNAPAYFEANPFANNPLSNPQLDTISWIKFVLKKQN